MIPEKIFQFDKVFLWYFWNMLTNMAPHFLILPGSFLSHSLLFVLLLIISTALDLL